MAGASRRQRSDKPSIKYKCSQPDGVSLELSDFDFGDCAPSFSESRKCGREDFETKDRETLSTSDLVSAVSDIWDYATRPLSVLFPKTSSRYADVNIQKGNILGDCNKEEASTICASAADQFLLSVSVATAEDSSPVLRGNLDSPKAAWNPSLFGLLNGNHSIIPKIIQNKSLPYESQKYKGVASVEISGDLRHIYAWMGKSSASKATHMTGFSRMTTQNCGDSCIGGTASSPPDICLSEATSTSGSTCNSLTRNLEILSDKAESSPPVIIHKENSVSSTDIATTGLSLKNQTGLQATKGTLSEIRSPRPHEDLHLDPVASSNCACEGSISNTSSNPCDDKDERQPDFTIEKDCDVKVCISEKGKTQYKLAKQEHAFAGAMAGIFVSLCLHPVDTIKTVVQSCHNDQRSLHDIGKSIVSNRGVTGLYRGISSNIASSAPISAIYTYTYESVKGALLPLFPKEFQSLAHCTAGGCASIATSFIFTPSERIKQQMQIGSSYQNCWRALVEIVAKGGLPSLYAGWGAVLCRNIPHSIIKFYTYESLKRLVSSSDVSNSQPNTLTTLVCGGLAGSTAALFTTPFDVVKTRLQTQIPGSMNQCDGVLNTLKDIAKREGLTGLYRGLTPRLVMYMTQGALFFASYETFKRLFALEMPELDVQPASREENIESDPTSLPAPG